MIFEFYLFQSPKFRGIVADEILRRLHKADLAFVLPARLVAVEEVDQLHRIFPEQPLEYFALHFFVEEGGADLDCLLNPRFAVRKGADDGFKLKNASVFKKKLDSVPAYQRK